VSWGARSVPLAAMPTACSIAMGAVWRMARRASLLAPPIRIHAANAPRASAASAFPVPRRVRVLLRATPAADELKEECDEWQTHLYWFARFRNIVPRQ
jgi:hypothetical protein